MKKTNAARLLDRKKIFYRLEEYEVDLNDLSAVNVAKKVSLPIEQIFKTIVLRGSKKGIFLCCVPGDCELELKQVAQVAEDKKVSLVALKEVEKLTGYLRGGVSPLGGKKDYPVFLHKTALKFEEIAISAGVRGTQLILSPQDLLDAAEVTVACLTGKEKEE